MASRKQDQTTGGKAVSPSPDEIARQVAQMQKLWGALSDEEKSEFMRRAGLDYLH